MTSNYRKQTFQIYFQHLRKYQGTVILALVSVIIAAAVGAVAPLFYKDFFNILASNGQGGDNISQLQHILLKILLVYAVSWIFWRAATFCASYFQARGEEDLYNSCFAYLHRHSISFFNNNFVGSLVKKVNRFTDAYVGIVDIFLWDIMGLVMALILFTAILFQRNIWLGLGLLAWSLVYMAVCYSYSLYKLKFDLKKAGLSSKMTGVLADTITNQLNVKLFTGYHKEIRYFGQVNNQYHNLRLFTWNLDNIFEAVQALFMIVLEIGIFFIAVHLWQAQLITIGDFVLIQAYVLGIIMRLWNFARILRRYYEYMANAEEMTEVLETPQEIVDSRQAKDLVIKEGAIEFKDISFNYSQTRKIVAHLNLSIKSKEKIAIIGPSGAGKSTLVNLLLRNFDLARGSILIDGQKISAVTQASLWKNIALVNQDPILFHRTLKENIAYGRPSASEAELLNASQLAHAHEFIITFTQGYKTYVGERGVKLSGGERQRVAIARAILKNAPILILDEATSSLDSESEYLIQDALNNLMRDKTVVVIAHRLSTIMKMDRIVVIDNGQIVEQGSHQNLLKKKDGLYKRLWERQAGGFIE